MPRVILIALDSVGIDPLGHGRPESVYGQSRFLFPRPVGRRSASIARCPMSGRLVETVVAEPDQPGAIGVRHHLHLDFLRPKRLKQHGLMQGLGLNEPTLQQMIREDNLFRHFGNPCLANAIFPIHLSFLGGSYVEDLIPAMDRTGVEGRLEFDGRPVRFRGPDKHGFAEMFTLGEINQNVFVYAAREAGVALRTWDDVREGRALTGTMTARAGSPVQLGGDRSSRAAAPQAPRGGRDPARPGGEARLHLLQVSAGRPRQPHGTGGPRARSIRRDRDLRGSNSPRNRPS